MRPFLRTATEVTGFSGRNEGMRQNQELTFAYAMAIVLFVVGVACYAYPEKKPEQPVRIMLKSIGGGVLLDHKKHTASSGYGVPCSDCHHTGGDPKNRPESCSADACHKADNEDAPKRGDAFHKLCKGCHEDGGMGPVKCAACHML
jgi:hypothetical protein